MGVAVAASILTVLKGLKGAQSSARHMAEGKDVPFQGVPKVQKGIHYSVKVMGVVKNALLKAAAQKMCPVVVFFV